MIPAQTQIQHLPPRRRPARTSPSWRWVAGQVPRAFLRGGLSANCKPVSSLAANCPAGLEGPEEPCPPGQKAAAASGSHLPHPQEGCQRRRPASPHLCGGGTSQRLDVQGLHRWDPWEGLCSQESLPPLRPASQLGAVGKDCTPGQCGPQDSSHSLLSALKPLGGRLQSVLVIIFLPPPPLVMKKRRPPGQERKRRPFQQRGCSLHSHGCLSFRAWLPPPSRYIREGPSSPRRDPACLPCPGPAWRLDPGHRLGGWALRLPCGPPAAAPLSPERALGLPPQAQLRKRPESEGRREEGPPAPVCKSPKGPLLARASGGRALAATPEKEGR